MRTLIRLAGSGALALTLGLLAVPPAQAATTITVTVPANQAPPPGITTLNVTDGDSLTVTATGSATYGPEGDPSCQGYPITHPDGSRDLGGIDCGPKYDQNATLPSAPVGALIGRISNGGGWFTIGSSRTWTAGRTGTLYLLYNDSKYSDNTGSYSATVKDNG